MVTITDITSGSAAERSGIQKGEVLLCINDNEINDSLDYSYHSTASRLVVRLADRTVTVNKTEYEPLGLSFENDLFDGKRSCKNRCMFCFIDQLPSGMRESLYLKDDDERLSFLMGNYITLTNLTDSLIERIITMRFSPINISVHTMNKTLRSEMMGNRRAGDVLSLLPRFAQAGITMNIQLVLCPGVNDGDELEYSLSELQKLYPAVQSVSAVPVGLSRHRDSLAPLKPFDGETAKKNLDIIRRFGRDHLKKHGERLFFASDEIYLLAKRPIPTKAHYEQFCQIENGVGMWRVFFDSHKNYFKRFADGFDLATGILAAPLIERLCEGLANVSIHPIKNDFFGHGVTVAGLLTGQDVIAQLDGKLTTKTLLLPRDMFRAEGDITLDDMTIEDIEQALNTKVICVE